MNSNEEIDLPFEIGKTYKTKFQTGEKFIITDIVWSFKYEGEREKRVKVKNKMIYPLGFYENKPEIKNCLINFDRLIPEKSEPSISEQSNIDENFCWDDNSVIDFVNWYIKLHKLSFRYTLENRMIIESFKKGDKVSDWHHDL